MSHDTTESLEPVSAPKYCFTGETKVFAGITLKRIRALVSFGAVVKGELGGWIESESNLSQISGNAWVHGDAWVSGNARVHGNASLLTVGPIGSRNATLTVTADAKIGVRFSTGCFTGSRDQFVAAVAKDHPYGQFRQQYDLAVALADCSIVPGVNAADSTQEAAA